jgi:hypothetical protein
MAELKVLPQSSTPCCANGVVIAGLDPKSLVDLVTAAELRSDVLGGRGG